MNPNRGIYKHFLSPELCQQLLFIHRALGVVGYRPFVRSTTLFDVVLAEPRLLPALVQVRQMVLDIVEEHFDRPCQVFVEHTSLISWTAGASIGWHHDANRDYLAQRHFSVVLYISTKDVDFTGGTFCFQSGSPARVEPSAGMLLVYASDESNVHCVEPVTSGERATLTMWFTLDQAHQEDAKVLSSLSSQAMYGAGLPSTMYQQSPDGADIRLEQLQQLGVQLTTCQPVHQPVNVPEQQAQLQQCELPRRSQQQQEQQEQQEQHQHDSSRLQFKLIDASGACVAQFSSILEAALTLYMVQWKLCHHRELRDLTTAAGEAHTVHGCVLDHATAAANGVLHEPLCQLQHQSTQSSLVQPAGQQLPMRQYQQQQQTPQRQSGHTACGCFVDPKQVSRGCQLLLEYLQAADEKLQQLRPMWAKLGALVAPSVDHHHDIVGTC